MSEDYGCGLQEQREIGPGPDVHLDEWARTAGEIALFPAYWADISLEVTIERTSLDLSGVINAVEYRHEVLADLTGAYNARPTLDLLSAAQVQLAGLVGELRLLSRFFPPPPPNSDPMLAIGDPNAVWKQALQRFRDEAFLTEERVANYLRDQRCETTEIWEPELRSEGLTIGADRGQAGNAWHDALPTRKPDDPIGGSPSQRKAPRQTREAKRTSDPTRKLLRKIVRLQESSEYKEVTTALSSCIGRLNSFPQSKAHLGRVQDSIKTLLDTLQSTPNSQKSKRDLYKTLTGTLSFRGAAKGQPPGALDDDSSLSIPQVAEVFIAEYTQAEGASEVPDLTEVWVFILLLKDLITRSGVLGTMVGEIFGLLKSPVHQAVVDAVNNLTSFLHAHPEGITRDLAPINDTPSGSNSASDESGEPDRIQDWLDWCTSAGDWDSKYSEFVAKVVQEVSPLPGLLDELSNVYAVRDDENDPEANTKLAAVRKRIKRVQAAIDTTIGEFTTANVRISEALNHPADLYELRMFERDIRLKRAARNRILDFCAWVTSIPYPDVQLTQPAETARKRLQEMQKIEEALIGRVDQARAVLEIPASEIWRENERMYEAARAAGRGVTYGVAHNVVLIGMHHPELWAHIEHKGMLTLAKPRKAYAVRRAVLRHSPFKRAAGLGHDTGKVVVTGCPPTLQGYLRAELQRHLKLGVESFRSNQDER